MSMHKWKVLNWGDVATLEYGKSLKGYTDSCGKVPVYGTNGPIGTTDKALCNFPSVIVGRKGAYRGVHYSKEPFFVIDTAFYLKPKIQELDIKYAYYQLLTQNINEMDSGSAIPSTSREDFYNLQLRLPPLHEQKRIASILSSLDDKIDLNRQTAQTIEAIAQAIFKEWFVDFNFPGATGKMQESELGEIPNGWRVGVLGEICKNVRRSVHPKDLQGEAPYLGLEHIQRKNLSIPSWGISTEVDSQKFKFEQGDVLFGKLRPYFHKVGIAPVSGICSTDILVIQPNEKEYYSFVVNHLYDDKLISHVSAIADGTRMPRVDWKSMSDYRIVIPSKIIVEKFNKAVSECYNQLLLTIEENQNLTLLRDTLLPKLMKQEINA